MLTQETSSAGSDAVSISTTVVTSCSMRLTASAVCKRRTALQRAWSKRSKTCRRMPLATRTARRAYKPPSAEESRIWHKAMTHATAPSASNEEESCPVAVSMTRLELQTNARPQPTRARPSRQMSSKRLRLPRHLRPNQRSQTILFRP